MGARPTLTVVTLAAGKGKRLRSKTAKVLHPLAGRPMVAYVVDAARALKPRRLITVVGHHADRVRTALSDSGCEFVLQREQRGTGHAVLCAARGGAIAASDTLVVLNGDLPTLRPATLRRLVAKHRRSRCALSLITAELADPTGYGRIVRDERGGVVRIVEHGDASPAERRIHEVNCGIYCARPSALLAALRRVRPRNVQGEYYITDAVRELIGRGERVVALLHDDAEEVLGVNDRDELARAARTLYSRKAAELQRGGVTLLDPASSWIDPRARVGRDTVIYPGVIIEGPSRIGEDCLIRSGCRLSDSRVGDGVEILEHCVVLQSRIGDRVRLGPFAHLRPESTLEADCRVGNFVEVKKTRLGRGSKANHLTYLGDATIGPGCNIGAGTITCNYDGTNKFPTVLGKGVFIGSDTQLVAPVRLRDGSYVAAGTTVTQDVPAGALALSRTRQRNVEGWVARKRAKPKARGKRRKD